jgi:ethanolaminephosphotransferase
MKNPLEEHTHLGTGYVSQQGVLNLATYAYSGQDRSILANYVMKHFWNWLIDHVVPRWIAPNLLTLSGLICVLLAYLSVIYACPSSMEFCSTVSSGTCVFAALMIFLYQTADNLDGKQARKTGSASPLGEVFDHGGDSLTVPLFAVIMGTVFQLDVHMTFISLIMMITLFYLAHWEAYFTRALILRPLANPTEAQLSMIGLLLFTAWKGSDFWLQQVPLPIFGLMQWNHIMFYITCLGFISNVSDHWYQVHKFFSSRQMSMRPAYVYLIPFGLLVLCSSIWIYATPGVLTNTPRLFMAIVGLLFSYLAIRSIVQSVCKEPFLLYYNVLSPLVLITLHAVIGSLYRPLVDYELIVQLYFLVALLHTAYLVTSIVGEFCYYLNIEPFRIKSQTLPI